MLVYPVLTLLAAGSILFLLGSLRRSRLADEASDQISRAIAYSDWPHVPEDRSRGVLPGRHGEAR